MKSFTVHDHKSLKEEDAFTDEDINDVKDILDGLFPDENLEAQAFVLPSCDVRGIKKKDLYQGDTMGQYIGILYNKGNILRIQSRFDDENAYFSHYLLCRMMGEKTYVPFKGSIFQEGNEALIEELLAIVLLEQINEAVPKGIYRKYCYRRYDDSKLQGTINIHEQIKRHPIFDGRFVYNTHEFAEDNNINLLIFSTYMMLEKKYSWLKKLKQNERYSNARDYLHQMGSLYTPVPKKDMHSLVERCLKKINQPMYCRWEKARRTAIEIQRHMKNFAGGLGKNQIVGILIDMDETWEIYLQQIFEAYVSNEEYAFVPQNINKNYFILEGNLAVRPDFYWKSQRGTYRLVLDAKNKPIWQRALEEWENQNNIMGWSNSRHKFWFSEKLRENINQVFSYMHVFHCSIGGIILPTQERTELPIQKIFRISDMREDQFCVIGLPVTLMGTEENFDEYREKTMKKREEKLGAIISDLLT